MELNDKDKKIVKEIIEKIEAFQPHTRAGVVVIGEPADEMIDTFRELNIGWYYVLPEIKNLKPTLDPNCLYILPADVINGKISHYDYEHFVEI